MARCEVILMQEGMMTSVLERLADMGFRDLNVDGMIIQVGDMTAAQMEHFRSLYPRRVPHLLTLHEVDLPLTGNDAERQMLDEAAAVGEVLGVNNFGTRFDNVY